MVAVVVLFIWRTLVEPPCGGHGPGSYGVTTPAPAGWSGGASSACVSCAACACECGCFAVVIKNLLPNWLARASAAARVAALAPASALVSVGSVLAVCRLACAFSFSLCFFHSSRSIPKSAVIVTCVALFAGGGLSK